MHNVAMSPWVAAALRPIYGFRLSYLPLIMVYFAYGALGLIDVSRDMWIKESLTLSPAELAGIGVWLALPWTVKMVFGELVDTVPLFEGHPEYFAAADIHENSTGSKVIAKAVVDTMKAHCIAQPASSGCCKP